MPDQISVLLDAPTSVASRMPLARLGDYHDKRYGDFKITAGDVADWQKNLEKLPGGRALIDEDHLANKPSPHRNTKASGWITGIELDGKQAYGNVEWTPRGEAAIKNKEYLFASPTFGKYTNDAGAIFENTLSGAALTNKPFLTSMPQIMLASEENLQLALEADPAMALLGLALDGELGEEYQNFALEQDDATRQTLLATLTTNARNDLKDSDFAIPGSRSYPIHDLAHARNALARVAQNGDSGEQAQVKSAVYRRYPALKPAAKNLEVSDSPGTMKLTADILKTLGITDQAKIDEILQLASADEPDVTKLLEAIEAAKPEAPVKTLEEQAKEKGVTLLSAEDHEALKKKAADAEAQAAEANKQLEASGAEPVKTLEEQATEAGMTLLDSERVRTLEDTASKVPGLEVAVKKLSDDAEASRKELQDGKFETAYSDAEREGKASPANKERMKAFFQLDADNTLAMLSEAEPIVNMAPKGRNAAPAGDDVPANTHAQHHELEGQIEAYMQEHDVAYFKALEAVSGVTVPGMVS